VFLNMKEDRIGGHIVGTKCSKQEVLGITNSHTFPT
jgi:hypothetical protein